MVTLTGNSLTMDQMKRILFENVYVQASDDSLHAVKKCREKVEQIVDNGEVVYGITTGFGKFSDVFIAKENVSALQYNLIASHACGVGEPFPELVSRAMLVLRANTM
jgi:histidine ammonia-lyase